MLRNQQELGACNHVGIFQRLVLAFRHRQHDNAMRFA